MGSYTCGISAFLSQDGRGPHIETLKRIVLACEARRGGHAAGFAYVDQQNEMHVWKRPGEFADNKGQDLEMVDGALAVIVHARFATHGNCEDNANNHPHKAGRGWYVHNGVVHNYRELAAKYHLTLTTQCDSEVLGQLIMHWPGSLVDRAQWAAEQTTGNMTIMGLWRDPIRLLIVKSGYPLFFSRVTRGYYLSSTIDGLPGVVKDIPQEFVDVLRYTPVPHPPVEDIAAAVTSVA